MEISADKGSRSDAAGKGTYHFLDVGRQKYGECTLVRFGKISVLIDGSHESDFNGQDGYDSIPEQLEEIFGHPPPFSISLAVVTHCHADHVGCLPALVSEGIIVPAWALLTDQKLGFGRSQDDTEDSPDLADERTAALAAALREEDASDLSDEALQAFIDTAATVESKYRALISKLKALDARVIQYRGQKLPADLVQLMKPAQMVLLGPSSDQLVFAADQIATTNKDAADAVHAALVADASLSNLDLYRSIVAADDASDAKNPRGNGMNCQSITLAFGPKEARVLLAGDMQFTEPGVHGADDEVMKLRQKVAEYGPYRVFKTTHHTSHNGQDDDFLTELGNPEIIVHSGGLNDASHPYPTVLKMLKARSRRIAFARTDRNGAISVQPHLPLDRAIEVSRGRLNDFTKNETDTELLAPASRSAGAVAGAVSAEMTGGQIVIVNLPSGPVDMTIAGVDIVVRAASAAVSGRRDQLSAPQVLESARRGKLARPSSSLAIDLAAGRELPRLLFVTNRERLEENIGQRETESALTAVRERGHVLCDVSESATNPMEQATAELKKDKEIAGVVIAGGYDVVPSAIVDVLTPKLRATIANEVADDGDEFVVWSDEGFGDIDADHIAERPVSRIPDARDATLFLKALEAKGIAPNDRFGIRNIARPFANDVWAAINGSRDLNVSEKFLSEHVPTAHTSSACHYFMLHGSDSDGSTFTGEYDDGSGYTLAFEVSKVPQVFSGVVFTGCCWGALTVSQKAKDATTAHPVPRASEESIALSYLKAGANAFIGCTGSHYSGPSTDLTKNYAAILHAAFWATLPELNYAPSAALFGARLNYGRLISKGPTKPLPLVLARRLKNRAQFTCLGLGW